MEHEERLAGIFYEEVRDIESVEVYGDFSSPDRTAVVSLNVEGYSSKEAGPEKEEPCGFPFPGLIQRRRSAERLWR